MALLLILQSSGCWYSGYEPGAKTGNIQRKKQFSGQPGACPLYAYFAPGRYPDRSPPDGSVVQNDCPHNAFCILLSQKM
jgi:hypothetical protein